MHYATADAVASVRINTRAYMHAAARDASVIHRYIRWFATPTPQLSDTKPETLIYRSSPLEPAWLETTQERIRKSVIPNDRAAENDGRWLSQEIASAASDFLKKTADLLPEEPFIYSSQRGDLVAEFKAEHGTMTSIVSPTFVLLFAVVDGEPLERKISEVAQMRGQVEELTELLRTGQHGAVDTSK